MAVGSPLVTIDGAHGEGGGALLRSALVMSSLTQQPMRVVDIRGGSRHHGLDPEDLTLIGALAESTAAETTGVTPGANQFSFVPTRHPKGIGGSLATFRNESNRGPNALVVLNSLLPVLSQSGVYCTISAEGETFGAHTLSYDAFANTTLEVLKAAGLYAFSTLEKAGFGRESRGEVLLEIEPSHLDGLNWAERGKLVELRTMVSTAGIARSVGERAVSHAQSLAKQTGIPMNAEHLELEGLSPGCHVTVWARFERGCGGGSAMGTRGLRVETLCQHAFAETLEWIDSQASLDPYIADQILIPCAFAENPSTFTVSRITQRLLTSIWVVKQFLPIHITVRGAEGQPGTVAIRH